MRIAITHINNTYNKRDTSHMHQLNIKNIKLTSSKVILGLSLASGANHKKIPYKLPIPNCNALIVIGKPAAPPVAFNANLFEML